MKLTIRQMMLTVAAVAVVLGLTIAAVRALELHAESTYSHLTDRLSQGQHVIVRRSTDAHPENRANPSKGLPVGPIAAGTELTVLLDLAWDADACYPSREIKTEVASGPHKGKMVWIERKYLRRKP